eukprot:gene17777-biopygen18362
MAGHPEAEDGRLFLVFNLCEDCAREIWRVSVDGFWFPVGRGVTYRSRELIGKDDPSGSRATPHVVAGCEQVAGHVPMGNDLGDKGEEARGIAAGDLAQPDRPTTKADMLGNWQDILIEFQKLGEAVQEDLPGDLEGPTEDLVEVGLFVCSRTSMQLQRTGKRTLGEEDARWEDALTGRRPRRALSSPHGSHTSKKSSLGRGGLHTDEDIRGTVTAVVKAVLKAAGAGAEAQERAVLRDRRSRCPLAGVSGARRVRFTEEWAAEIMKGRDWEEAGIGKRQGSGRGRDWEEAGIGRRQLREGLVLDDKAKQCSSYEEWDEAFTLLMWAASEEARELLVHFRKWVRLMWIEFAWEPVRNLGGDHFRKRAERHGKARLPHVRARVILRALGDVQAGDGLRGEGRSRRWQQEDQRRRRRGAERAGDHVRCHSEATDGKLDEGAPKVGKLGNQLAAGDKPRGGKPTGACFAHSAAAGCTREHRRFGHKCYMRGSKDHVHYEGHERTAPGGGRAGMMGHAVPGEATPLGEPDGGRGDAGGAGGGIVAEQQSERAEAAPGSDDRGEQPAARYAGHSLRRGWATAALRLQMDRLYIKLQRDWKSDCYERYCELDDEQRLILPAALAEAAKALS